MRLEIGKELTDMTEVCRYFSFESFVNLLETGQLTFTKVSNWEDPWENELSNYELEIDGKKNKNHYSSSTDFFGQCWTQKLESDAMWRIYSPNKSGVKVYTQINRLNTLSNIRCIGVEKVSYFSNLNDLKYLTENDSSRYETVKYKRIAFSHEEEVRFIIHPCDVLTNSDYDATHINLDISIQDFILRIEIDPRADIWVENMIKKYVNRKLENTVVSKSNLYEKNTDFKIIRSYTTVDTGNSSNT